MGLVKGYDMVFCESISLSLGRVGTVAMMTLSALQTDEMVVDALKSSWPHEPEICMSSNTWKIRLSSYLNLEQRMLHRRKESRS